jgi:hypothetical protein
MIASWMLAGLPVRDQDVLELARLLRDAGSDNTAERLEDAYDAECKILAPEISERMRSFGHSRTAPMVWQHSAVCSFVSMSGAAEWASCRRPSTLFTKTRSAPTISVGEGRLGA